LNLEKLDDDIRNLWRGNLSEIEKELLRGDISEIRVNRVLNRMKGSNLCRIFDFFWIRSVKKFNFLDKRGVDFIIFLGERNNLKVIPLQVKSSYIGALNHRANSKSYKKEIKYKGLTELMIGKDIPVIIVSNSDDASDLKRKIMKIMNGY